MRSFSLCLFALCLTMGLTACSQGSFQGSDAEESEELTSELSSSQRLQRVTVIKQAALEAGLENTVLLAGIANSETYLAHCWSEATWACQGPASSSCGGGPVIAGSGDGPCYLQEGGLGYFQFDAGTFSQTLDRYGSDVLTIEGNTRHAVDYVIDMVLRSQYISGVSTGAQALEWLNSVRVDGRHWDAWIKTVVLYYNGCRSHWSCYSQRYGKYSKDTRDLYYEFGPDFWDAKPLQPIETYWARQADGSYNLRALAAPDVARVIYRVDGYEIGQSTRAQGHNFPDSYTFNQESRERLFVVEGFDQSGKLVAQGRGLIDVTPEYGVYIRQLTGDVYAIGLERAPEGVGHIEVEIDGYPVGKSTADRLEVRPGINASGQRQFSIHTFGHDGIKRGTLRRTFEIK